VGDGLSRYDDGGPKAAVEGGTAREKVYAARGSSRARVPRPAVPFTLTPLA
jgi:hypothetical protein